MADVGALRAGAEEIWWYHSIDLGHGVVTRGASANPMVPDRKLPDLRGRTVLDIGAWDGLYSFTAERLGASRVVALDHYAWGLDFAKRDAYWAECAAAGVLPDHERDIVDFWDESLPGRRGFDFARAALGSKVEPVVGDFMTIDLASLGTFDVVLYLGVLYHVRQPLIALERLRRVCEEVALIETEAIDVRGYEGDELVRFVAGNDLSADYGNWWVPSMPALHGLCRAAGFETVSTVAGPPPPRTRSFGEKVARRVLGKRDITIDYYRAAVHARV